MKPNPLKLQVENLEIRITPTTGIALQAGGILYIEGTAGDDQILLFPIRPTP